MRQAAEYDRILSWVLLEQEAWRWKVQIDEWRLTTECLRVRSGLGSVDIPERNRWHALADA